MFARIAALMAIAVSLGWAALCVLVFFPQTFLSAPLVDPVFFSRVVIIIAPLMIIWVFAYAAIAEARGAERLWNLQNQIQSLRSLLANYDQKWSQNFSPPDDALNSAGGWADTPSGIPDPEPPPPQATPALKPDGRAVAITRDILIRALDFADDENDVEAFEALDKVAEDPEIAELLEMAMDVLQLLATADMAVEALPSDYARPESWRLAFAQGRNNPLTTLGGIGTSADLEKVASLLESEPEFRSMAARFVNRTESLLGPFIADADDQEIFEIANTRTIRACILMENALAEE